MIFDKQGLFSDDQAITATAVSTNYIDLGAVGTPVHAAGAVPRDLGYGHMIPIRAQVTEAFNTLTTLTLTVEMDDNSSFSSATTVWTSTAVALASLVAGYQFSLNNVPIKITERYVRLRYTVGGSNPSTGKITAGIVHANDQEHFG